MERIENKECWPQTFDKANIDTLMEEIHKCKMPLFKEQENF